MKTLEQQIAQSFSAILTEWLGEDKMKQINDRNGTPEYKGCCASHDFCDSNVAVVEAFNAVVGREFDIENEEDNKILNISWDIARANKFKT